MLLGSGSDNLSPSLITWNVYVPLVLARALAGEDARVMEVIKIPWEHVDACLFFRPGGEDGELRGRDTVLRVRRTVGGERGDGRQMPEK